MKNNKKLIQEFNQKDTLMVFSSYALKDKDVAKQNALAWYTKELISTLPKNQKIIVLAEKINDSKMVIRNNILIIPCWEKRNFGSILNTFSYYSTFNKVKNVLIEFEFNYFGHIFGPLIKLVSLLYLKMLGKNILFQIHEIVTNLYVIRKQINLNNKLALKFFNFSLGIFYRLINLLSNRIIVTETSLATRFKKITGSKKVTILPIMVKSKLNKTSLAMTPKQLKILFFGYLSWYKGIDKLVEIFPYLRKKIPNLELIVAGDASPTLVGDSHYDKWYKDLKGKMKKEKGITHKGFVSDSDAGSLIEKSDLLILPYRVFKSSSGPLSWALSHRKPVIFSKALKEYKKSPDFKVALKKANLNENDIFFDLNKNSLLSMLELMDVKKLQKFSRELAEARSEKNVAKILTGLLETKQKQIFNWLPAFLPAGRHGAAMTKPDYD